MSKIHITLDPGHYNDYNKGIVNGYYEGNRVFELAGYLRDELLAKGIFEVSITRAKVTDNPSLEARGKKAIANKSSLFLSLHSDAFSNPAACGVSVFYSAKRPNSKVLGTALGSVVAEYMKSINGVTYLRGVNTKVSNGADYYGVIRSAVSSGNVENVFILEHGFHTNQKECAVLNNPTHLKEIAKLEANVIYNHFKDKKVADEPVKANEYILHNDVKGYSNAADAMANKPSNTVVKKNKYYIYRTYSNGAINITNDKTGRSPGWWINPNMNKESESPKDPEGALGSEVKEVTPFIVNTKLLGYKNADDAMSNKSSSTILSEGEYYIYKIYTNGAVNITKDKTAKTPGWWINPTMNVISEKKEENQEVDTTGLTPLTMSFGNLPVITAEQAVKYVKSKTSDYKLTCTLEELVYNFIKAGYIENIRWDIAFAQSIKETGFFRYGGQVSWDQNNYAGIGATNDGADGNKFKSSLIGAIAQMQHLKAYANEDDPFTTLYDARFALVRRGWAPYAEWLGLEDNPRNKNHKNPIGWAVPGKGYGYSILNILNEIKKM